MEITDQLPTKPLISHNHEAKRILENDSLEMWAQNLIIP
jgi:hypothetical protein